MYENLFHLSLLTTFMVGAAVISIGLEIRNRILSADLQHELCVMNWSPDKIKNDGVYASITVRFQNQLISSLVKIGRPDVLTTMSDSMLARIARQVSQLSYYELHSEQLSLVETDVFVVSYRDGVVDKNHRRVVHTKTLSLPANPIKDFLRLRF